MQKLINRPIVVPFLLATFSFLTFMYTHQGEEIYKIVLSDALGYYQYLPGLFVDNDLRCLYYAAEMENGNMLNIFHIGVAILEMPFFLLSHLFAWLFGFKQDGYSAIYMYGIGIGAAFYLGAGVFFLRKFLEGFWEKKIALLSVLIIYFGTNLYYYSGVEVGMSHVYSFFLFAVFAYYSQLFNSSQSTSNSLILGLLAGLIIVIRPNNGIVILLLVFYGISSFRDILPRIKWWFTNYRSILVMLFAGGIILFLQMSYWYYITGKWLVFSYGQLGQQFFWTKAVMGKVLFSPQNGFFVYAPIALFAIIGLIAGILKREKSFFIYLLIWALAWYIFASWWCWWFGGAYGHRAFIEYFVIMAPGLAYLLDKLRKNTLIKGVLATLIVLFIFINVRMTFTYASPWDGPEWGWDDYSRELGRVFFLKP